MSRSDLNPLVHNPPHKLCHTNTSTKLTVALFTGVICVTSQPGCQPATAPSSRAADLFVAASDPRMKGSADEEESVWTKAVAPRGFQFPADHGSHEDFRIEWWYYTGNLSNREGRRFGYQLTFFRTGLHRQPQNPSRWAVRNLYTAHFAISDIENRRHIQSQRNHRGALALSRR